MWGAPSRTTATDYYWFRLRRPEAVWCPLPGNGKAAMFRQLLTPLMVGAVGNAQLTGDLSNWFATGLCEPYCFTLKFLGVRLLDFLHVPASPSGIVYPKLSLLHKSGGSSAHSTR